MKKYAVALDGVVEGLSLRPDGYAF